MNLDPDDFAATYARMGDLELLELARSYDSLTDSAQSVLRAEFDRRNLDPPIVEDSEDDVPDRRDLVTLRRYRDLSEAIVARTMLESAGIYVFLRDENLVRLDWQVSNFIGGIRLQVETKDEPFATELLDQVAPVAIPFADEDDFIQPHCPTCGSTDITFQGSSRGAALASLYVLSLPLPLGRKTWLCNSCDAVWDDAERGYGTLAHWRGLGFESLAALATPRHQSCVRRDPGEQTLSFAESCAWSEHSTCRPCDL